MKLQIVINSIRKKSSVQGKSIMENQFRLEVKVALWEVTELMGRARRCVREKEFQAEGTA